MTQPGRIPVRELRNHVSEVLRRVEAGETFEITVNNRPVARLSPRHVKPMTSAARRFLENLPQADPALRSALAEELTETTEDLADPWR